jgi:hypothetical protein
MSARMHDNRQIMAFCIFNGLFVPHRLPRIVDSPLNSEPLSAVMSLLPFGYPV